MTLENLSSIVFNVISLNLAIIKKGRLGSLPKYTVNISGEQCSITTRNNRHFLKINNLYHFL